MSIKFTRHSETPISLKPCQHVILEEEGIIKSHKLVVHTNKDGKTSVQPLKVQV